MSAFEDTPETEIGRALFEELVWIHRMIRRDLEKVRQLAADVVGEMSAAEVAVGISDLKNNGKLWQLKVGCLRYCHFVHSHHNLEDVAFFPALRRANPALNTVVDKLEADHRVVSDLLDAVEAGAAVLTEVDSAATRQSLADGLQLLAQHLLLHLDYEELNAGPTLRRMDNI
ncbi:MAG: hemerythrin domain-containing protein [Candidatus Eremiobacteraeota bacterium]|nr:hemerythrin domain-containing protein [Candidatus Eremiobacteraeota bacterium]